MSEPFKIGQLVGVYNHPYFQNFEENKSEEDYKYVGSTISCSSDNYPLMMVKEYTQSIEQKKELDSETKEVKEVSKLKTKYLCVWYDSKLGSFQEAWFKQGELLKFPGEIEFLSGDVFDSDIKMSKQVFLRTTIIERYKEIQNQKRENDRFVSSSFVIKDFKKESQEEWWNEKLNYLEKKISAIKVKVQWFNVAKGKYSEEWLPIEFLKLKPDVIKKKWRTLKPDAKNSARKFGARKLMSYLNGGEHNYVPANNAVGKSLESLIYFYIKSKRKAILDDRVQAFDRYLKKNGYRVYKAKVSINSAGFRDYEQFFAPIDLLLKDKENKLIAVDLLSGSGLIEDGQAPPRIYSSTELSEREKDGEVIGAGEKELGLYNGRAFIIQEILRVKYKEEGIVSKSKLLVINKSLRNILKEYDVKDCPESLAKVKKA